MVTKNAWWVTPALVITTLGNFINVPFIPFF